MNEQCKGCMTMWWEYDETGRLVDFGCPEWETFTQEDYDLVGQDQCPRFIPKERGLDRMCVIDWPEGEGRDD